MRLQVLSDLHLEFHGDQLDRLCRALPTRADVDALVLAGDIGIAVEPGAMLRAFRLFAERAPRILFVPGNHEFYGSSVGDTLAVLRKLVADFETVTMLEPGTVLQIAGRRILGCTMWFPAFDAYDRVAETLNDFSVIEGFVPWVHAENARHQGWLRREVQEGDVVITHHLPSPHSIHPRYAGSPLNRFFLCNMSDLIAERKPALWIHGHTHDSVDYQSDATHVVCNPFGYAGVEENARFIESLVVELP